MVRVVLGLGLVVLLLWLLSSVAVGCAASLSMLSGRAWQLAWWLQHFGIGVACGFVLGVVCGWLVLALVARSAPLR
jgi:hypothetical protein